MSLMSESDSSPTTSPLSTRFCSKCGGPTEGRVFCTECGSSLADIEKSKSAVVETQSLRSVPEDFAYFLGLVLLGIGIIFVFSGWREDRFGDSDAMVDLVKSVTGVFTFAFQAYAFVGVLHSVVGLTLAALVERRRGKGVSGYGGWLALLTTSLIIGSLLCVVQIKGGIRSLRGESVLQSTPSASEIGNFLLVTLVLAVLGGGGAFGGILLSKGRRAGILVSRLALIGYIIVAASWVLMAASRLTPEQRLVWPVLPFLSPDVVIAVEILITAVIWLLYLWKSERVQNTFGD
jgi:hypothetical protein